MKRSLFLTLASFTLFLFACSNNVTSTEMEEEPEDTEIQQTQITMDNEGLQPM